MLTDSRGLFKRRRWQKGGLKGHRRANKPPGVYFEPLEGYTRILSGGFFVRHGRVSAVQTTLLFPNSWPLESERDRKLPLSELIFEGISLPPSLGWFLAGAVLFFGRLVRRG